jgi:serine/threonine protein kinase/tetratricopeptide (TPR) repeat protein
MPIGESPTNPRDSEATHTDRDRRHGHEALEFVGPYRVLERLGTGGFGDVYSAEQRSPVVRKVALKILKRGMDTDQFVARFEAERQALAMMDHPSIASIFDGGATPDGRPYFVMELVNGEPITQHCDRQALTTRERLELFVQVCHAVQHAHQKGIIHRDIKPSNVLVTVVDAVAVPKVIDFGIAKATAVPLTDKTLHTRVHEVIGTPEYMSPEQAERTTADIDTRSDIYSLGVLLYELLTGTTPLDRQQVEAVTFGDLPRLIREVEPPTPSTRLRQRLETLAHVAARRRSSPARLPIEVKGDLDWIVMKCLEKDRTRRYDTANALADDLQRHLSGEPVTAAPPSTAYRVSKFVRRHRAAVTVAAALTILLLGGITGTSYGLLRAEQRRREAVRERLEAEAQKATAEQVVTVFQDMLKSVRADVAQGRDTTVLRQMVDRTRDRIEAGEFKSQPLVEISLRHSLGLTYIDLADYDSAERMLAGALHPMGRLTESMRRAPADAARMAVAMNNMGGLWFEVGRPDRAEAFFRTALDLRRESSTGDNDDLAQALVNHGSLLDQLGRSADGVVELREAVAMRERLFPGDHEKVAFAKAGLAFALQNLGQNAEAERLHREVLAIRQRVYSGPHPQVSVTMNNLAMVLGTLGREAEAEELYRQSLDVRRQLYKGDHPALAQGIANLAFATVRAGRYAEGEAMLRESVAMRRRLFKGDHPDLSINLDNLASAIRLQGRPADAEPIAREALAMGRRLFKADHPSVALTMNNLASILVARKRAEEAEAVARDAEAMLRRLFSRDHTYVARSLETMALVSMERRRLSDAEQYARDALTMRQRLFPGDHRDVAQSHHTLARVLMASGRAAEARQNADQAVAMARRVLPASHPLLIEYQETLARLPQ